MYEFILKLLLEGDIDTDLAKTYIANYENYQHQRTQLEQSHDGEWAASYDNNIALADSEVEVTEKIKNEPGAVHAYITQIGRSA